MAQRPSGDGLALGVVRRARRLRDADRRCPRGDRDGSRVGTSRGDRGAVLGTRFEELGRRGR